MARAPKGYRYPEPDESPTTERPWLICLLCERPVADFPPERSNHRTNHRLEVRRRAQAGIRSQVFDRDSYRCALRDVAGAGRCYGPLTPHHRRKASQGGGYTLENLRTLCRHHNDLLESHPDVAAIGERLGLVVRRVPRQEADAEAEDRIRERGARLRLAAGDRDPETSTPLSHPSATIGRAS